MTGGFEMNTKRWVALVIFFVLLISLIFNPPAIFGFLSETDDWKIQIYRDGKGDNIVLIDIDGVILSGLGSVYSSYEGYDHDIFLDKLNHAFEDDTVKGLVLRLNSPGGSVTACDEVLREIYKLRGDSEMPVVAYMDDFAASGAYMISTAADVIYANRHTVTGSIGVIMSTLNIHRLADNWGISEEVFKSGHYKDSLSPFREVEAEERRIMQGIIDESYDFLIESILQGREMDREYLIELSDGRLYSGMQAENNGLIDNIGFLDDAIDKTGELAGIEDPNVIHYVRTPPSFLELLFAQMRFRTGDFLNINYLLELQHKHYPSLMYLWRW